MRDSNLADTKKKNLFKDRAVMVCTITVTVFLCFLTVLELLTLKLEWNVPFVYAMVGDSDNYIFSQYREQEEALEQSSENEVATTEDIEVAGDDTEVTLSGGIVTELEGAGITEEETESTQEEPQAVEDPFPYYLKINRQQNVVTVYEKDENGEYTVPVKAILCSTGLYNATPKGTFQLSSKYVWRELNGGVYGQYASRITGGVLFHSVPYTKKNKATLSASKYNKLGQQASMGCVRLTVEDAKWIYDNCPSGTYVEIYDSEDPGPLGKPEALKLDADSPNKGWDPTDPDERNPWHAWSDDE